MSDLTDPFKLHESFRSTGDPFPENPFAQDDPRHEVWREETHTAETEAARLNSDILAWKASNPEDQVDRTIALFLGKFDIWASRHICVLWSDAAIHEYIQWLVDFAESGIRAAVTSCPAPISREVLTAELRVRFLQRVEYWKSQALEIRSGSTSRAKSGNQPQTQLPPAGTAAEATDNANPYPVRQNENRRRRLVKKNDLSRYLDQANLTDKQYKCASLKWEYCLTLSQIARDLGVHRTTVDQHIHSAQAKMRSAGLYDKVRKRLSQAHPGE